MGHASSSAPSLPVILGSRSAGRSTVLSGFMPAFTTMSPDIDENAITHDDPRVLALLRAEAKCMVLLLQIAEPSLLITADQTCVFEGELRDKPASLAQAAIWLAGYSNKVITYHSAVVVTRTDTREQRNATVTARMHVGHLTPEYVGNALNRGNVMRVGGGFPDDPELMETLGDITCDGHPDDAAPALLGLPRIATYRMIRELSHGTRLGTKKEAG